MLDRCLPWFVARAPCVPGAELPLILQQLMVVVPGTAGLPPPRGKWLRVFRKRKEEEGWMEQTGK